MHFPSGAVSPRRVDASLEIIPIMPGQGMPFDIAKAHLTGHHPIVVNRVSDRAYYFLKGTAIVAVGDSRYSVEAGDVVTVEAGVPHGLDGEAEYLVITSPPFSPQNEHPVNH